MSRGWVSVGTSTSVTECGYAASQAREIMAPWPTFQAKCFMPGEEPDGPMSKVIR